MHFIDVCVERYPPCLRVSDLSWILWSVYIIAPCWKAITTHCSLVNLPKLRSASVVAHLIGRFIETVTGSRINDDFVFQNLQSNPTKSCYPNRPTNDPLHCSRSEATPRQLSTHHCPSHFLRILCPSSVSGTSRGCSLGTVILDDDDGLLLCGNKVSLLIASNCPPYVVYVCTAARVPVVGSQRRGQYHPRNLGSLCPGMNLDFSSLSSKASYHTPLYAGILGSGKNIVCTSHSLQR